MLSDPSSPGLQATWLRYRRSGALSDDVVAALIVAVLLIPQSLAYAMLAGLPPAIGIYATLLPMLVYAALGSSSVNSVGPVAGVSLMTAQAIAPVVASGVSPEAAALVLATEAGVLLALAAWFKLDALAALLSAPVLSGFSTGAAITIAVSQLPALLGSAAKGVSTPQVLASGWDIALGHAPGVLAQGLAVVFGLGALVALLAARRWAAPMLRRWWGRPHA